MFESKFIKNNIKKFFFNLKSKKYFFNKNFFKFIYNLKNKIINKILFIKKKINKNLKIKKKYILKTIYIYKKYFLKINKNFKLIILKIPNIIHKITFNKNIIIKKKKFKNNKKKLKILINKKIKKFNIKISNITSGKGFFYMAPPYSLVYNILEKYIFNLHLKENNYKYIIVPNILNFKSFINSGQIPKFIKKLFIIRAGNKIKYLIPTSEVSLINFMIKKKIKSNYIPIKLFSKTECYRNEQLNYGAMNKNIIKQKQFNKLELMQFVDNKNSYRYLKELVKIVEKIIKNFKINYRIIELSKNNLSYISSKTFDLEVWIPSLNNFCEVSSCSNTENYQSIRTSIKYIKLNKNIEYFSIINGSGLAIGRFFLSLIEKYELKYIFKNILKKYKIF
ncbi:hypothetical protein QUR95_00010 [Candidatus Nasuia deltocephalinicola]|nr:hypothetical protein QUR95_00745 [Candidatus Nasuia deltocephalinicola]WKD87104.1 hypothetical protein QUR95_00010 [Candidatus Nasuia deltocephalinicola]